jgi:hypothetical protein
MQRGKADCDLYLSFYYYFCGLLLFVYIAPVQVLQERELLYEQLQKITEKDLKGRLQVRNFCIRSYITVNFIRQIMRTEFTYF